MSEPSAYEQYALELINAQRLNPQGAAETYGASGTITAAQLQPFAFNLLLNDAAEDHSLWLLKTNKFSHTGDKKSTAEERMEDAGYQFTGDSASEENLALSLASGVLNPLSALENNLEALFLNATSRAIMLDPQYREIGLGYELGKYKKDNAALLNENFAVSGDNKFITGVIYTDTDADDQFSYDEGVGGATIRIQPQGGSQEEFTNYATGGYTASTTASGLIDVEFSRNGTTVAVTIEMGVDNVKVDLRDTNFIASSASAFLGQGAVGLELLGINDTNATGNDGENIIVGNSGDNRMAGGEASDTLTGNGGSDAFVFDNCHDGVDQVTDFVSGTDTIEIGRLGFAQTMQLGLLGEDSLVFGTTATQNQAQFLYDQSTGNLSIDMDGTGIGEALLFANLGAGTALAYSDMVITAGGRAHSVVNENIVVVETNGAYELAIDLNGTYRVSNGVGTLVTLSQGGSDVGPARYAGWSALQAEATATGYTVLWQGPNGVYSLWQTNATGAHQSSQAMSAADLPLLEPVFHADLNGDGKIGVAETIEENGAYQLTVNPTNAYQISDGLDTPITLTHGGAEVGPAAYAGWYALQAEATETGYTVLWQASNGDYSLWQTDATGVYQTSRAVASVELPGLETVFVADLDGDGQIGIPDMIEDNGSYQLIVNQNNTYEISDGLGTQVTFSQGGSNVGPARYAGWSALQAEATDTGFTVLWQDPNGGYALWQTDAEGVYQSSKPITAAAFPGLETVFAADLDGNGQIGLPEIIEDNGAYQLTVNPTNAYQISDGVGEPITLTQSGADVGPARYAGWSALQVEATDTGFTVLWKDPNGGYALWQTDAEGVYQSSRPITAAAFPGLETVFAADLDGNGQIGLPEIIEDNGAYQLTVNPTNAYQISDGVGEPITLTQSGADVGPARYAGWSALQVEATDTGFTVLWKDPNGGYALWQTDAEGVYQSSRPITAAAFPGLETVFAADLDGNGQIGLPEIIEDNGAYQLTVNPTNAYEFSDGIGASITLMQGGLDVGPTRYAGWSALQVEAKGNGFAVLWQDPNGGYSVWQTDVEGNYQGAYGLQADGLAGVEALFSADLNGDGGIGLV
jgi:uncharacterized protein YkwD